MTARSDIAKVLEERAAGAISLSEGQALAAEADRLRRKRRGRSAFPLFYVRN